MPVARRYGQRQVGVSALPNARRSAADTSLSIGADLAREQARTIGELADEKQRTSDAGVQFLAQGAGIAIQVASKVRQQEQARALDLSAMETENALAEFERGYKFDPETGALKRRGKNAMGLPEEARGAFNTKADEIEATLANDAQRLQFQKIRLRRGSNFDLDMQRHTVEQIDAWEAEELTKTTANAKLDAIADGLDPKKVNEHMARGLDAIHKSGKRLGLGPEALTQQEEDFKSDVYRGIIGRLLNNQQLGAAQVYYEEHKQDIAGDKRGEIEGHLKIGGIEKRVLDESQRIIAKYGTGDKAEAAARQLDDQTGLVIKGVLQEIAVKQQKDEHAQVLKERATVDRSYAHVFRGGKVSQLPPADIATLGPSLGELARLELWMADPARTRRSDPGTRAMLNDMAAGKKVLPDGTIIYKDPETLKKFRDLRLQDYFLKLDAGEYSQLENMQLNYRVGKGESNDKVIDSFLSNEQMINATMRNYGIDPTPASGTANKRKQDLTEAVRGTVGQQLNTIVSTWSQKHDNQSMPKEDIQKEINRIFSTEVETWKKGLFGGTMTVKHVWDLTVEDIGKDMLPRIDNILANDFRTITPENRLDVYRTLISMGVIDRYGRYVQR